MCIYVYAPWCGKWGKMGNGKRERERGAGIARTWVEMFWAMPHLCGVFFEVHWGVVEII